MPIRAAGTLSSKQGHHFQGTLQKRAAPPHRNDWAKRLRVAGQPPRATRVAQQPCARQFASTETVQRLQQLAPLSSEPAERQRPVVAIQFAPPVDSPQLPFDSATGESAASPGTAAPGTTAFPAVTAFWSQLAGTSSPKELQPYLKLAARSSRFSDAAFLEERLAALSAALGPSNAHQLVIKHPWLLAYSPALLKDHMQRLSALLPNTDVMDMLARMPELLHYKPASLAHKLDVLYDMLPATDVEQVVGRCPTLLGLASANVRASLQQLRRLLPGRDVERMVAQYPSLVQCQPSKPAATLHALRQLLPAEVEPLDLVDYMPSLLLSNMPKVKAKWQRLQVLMMHRPRWRRDLQALLQKPASFARLLGISHRVIDRLAFLIERQEAPDLAASTILLMPKRKFEARYPAFAGWTSARNAFEAAGMLQPQLEHRMGSLPQPDIPQHRFGGSLQLNWSIPQHRLDGIAQLGVSTAGFIPEPQHRVNASLQLGGQGPILAEPHHRHAGEPPAAAAVTGAQQPAACAVSWAAAGIDIISLMPVTNSSSLAEAPAQLGDVQLGVNLAHPSRLDDGLEQHPPADLRQKKPLALDEVLRQHGHLAKGLHMQRYSRDQQDVVHRQYMARLNALRDS